MKYSFAYAIKKGEEFLRKSLKHVTRKLSTLLTGRYLIFKLTWINTLAFVRCFLFGARLLCCWRIVVRLASLFRLAPDTKLSRSTVLATSLAATERGDVHCYHTAIPGCRVICHNIVYGTQFIQRLIIVCHYRPSFSVISCLSTAFCPSVFARASFASLRHTLACKWFITAPLTISFFRQTFLAAWLTLRATLIV